MRWRDRAVVVTGRHSVELHQREPDQGALPSSHVEGLTLASMISPGTELNWYYDPLSDPPGGYPAFPGYTAVFEVTAVGDAVRELTVGDRALAFYGGHTGFQRQPADRVVRVSEELSPLLAPYARMMAISMATLTTTSARPPARIGVSGLGIVGQLATRVFAAAGYEVVAWDAAPERRALLPDEGVLALAAAPRQQETADDDPAGSGDLALVLECSGREQAVLDACAVVRKGGEVVMVGLPWRQHSNGSAYELLRIIWHRYVVLRSGWEYSIPDQPVEHVNGSAVENMTGAMRWLADSRIDVSGLAAVVPVSQAPSAYAGLRAKTWPALSAVFDWTA